MASIVTEAPSLILEALLWLGITTAILVAAHRLSAAFGNPYRSEED